MSHRTGMHPRDTGEARRGETGPGPGDSWPGPSPAGALAVMHCISPSGFFGAERVICNWTGGLSDVRTSLACFSRGPEHTGTFIAAMEQAGARAHLLPDRPAHMPLAVARLVGLLASEQPHILHCHGYKATVAGGLAALLHPVRVVVTQHGFTRRRSARMRAYEWLALHSCRLPPVRRIICVSGDILRTYESARIPPGRLALLANAVAVPEAEASGAGDPPRAPVVLFLGRLSPEKGPHVLLDALPEVARAHPGVSAVFAGDGPMRKDLEGQAGRLGLSASFPGFRSDAGEALRRATVVVVPSFTEGTPLALLEAMALGKAVVATAVGGIPTVVTHEKDGILVHPGDPRAIARALVELLGSPLERARLGARARETVRGRFNLAEQVRAVRRLYEEVAREPLRSRGRS